MTDETKAEEPANQPADVPVEIDAEELDKVAGGAIDPDAPPIRRRP
jgi:hypothetical protein